MDSPLVSVIIPFYNAELFLLRALNSILNQTYNSLELILINDGSTDRSTDIATDFCKVKDTYRLTTIANSGPGNARNIGLKQSAGEFITFLDADDELLPFAIQKMVNLMTQNIDLSIGMYSMFDTSFNKIKTTKWSSKNIISSNKAVDLFINNTLTPTVWGKLFRTSIAIKCSFPKRFWKEDDVFILQYLALSKQVSIIDDSLIKIHCRTDSLTRQTISTKMIKDIAFSYTKQHEIVKTKSNLSKKLFISQINTYLSLFLILKLDWKQIENKDEVLEIFQNEITLLCNNSKNYTLSVKKIIVINLINSTKKIGWKLPFLILQLFKNKDIKRLKQIKFNA
ncbi:MAG: glycosyltransferase family 2 protein [Flavobacteriaceae bacterium]